MRQLVILLCLPLSGAAQDAAIHQQVPQYSELPDMTATLQQQIDNNNGNLTLSGGKYFRITKPLVFDLTKFGAIKIRSEAGATIIMDGSGPALRIVGDHQGTAAPKSFKPATWNQRMPVVDGIEILGAHPEADGIELVQCVQPVISKVAVRWCRHAIRLRTRNRNVTLSDCHLYENSGVGVFLDAVNLHQINISNCHISYNRQGGIVVRDGNVRNLQVTGCDIEGNMPDDDTTTTTANILIDVSGTEGDTVNSIAEIAITGCTIQHSANYSADRTTTVAPGGANIRLAGKASYPINSVTITGNVLSDTTVNVDIAHAHDVTVASNTFFAPMPNNLMVRNSQRVTVTGNTFNPRQFVRPGTILFKDSSDCILSSSTLHHFATDRGAVVLDGCQGCILSALTLTDCGSGIYLKNTTQTTVSACRVTRTEGGGYDLWVEGESAGILLSGNAFSGEVLVPAK